VGTETPQKGAAHAGRAIASGSSSLYCSTPFFHLFCVFDRGKQGKRKKRVDRPALLRLSGLDAPPGEDECLSKDAGTRRSRVVLFLFKLLLEVIKHGQDLRCRRRDLQGHLMIFVGMVLRGRLRYAAAVLLYNYPHVPPMCVYLLQSQNRQPSLPCTFPSYPLFPPSFFPLVVVVSDYPTSANGGLQEGRHGRDIAAVLCEID